MCLGIPGQIIQLCDSEPGMALVDVSGVQRKVNIACVVNEERPAKDCIGDWVLVHVGFAMSRIDEEEAVKTLALLNEIGELQDELLSMQQSASLSEGGLS